MSVHPRKTVSNLEINKGSILLLFNDVDTEILRSWRIGRKLKHEARLDLLLSTPPLPEAAAQNAHAASLGFVKHSVAGLNDRFPSIPATSCLGAAFEPMRGFSSPILDWLLGKTKGFPEDQGVGDERIYDELNLGVGEQNSQLH